MTMCETMSRALYLSSAGTTYQGVVLLLVVAAVIPYALWKHGRSTDGSPPAEALSAWHPESPAPPVTTAPTWTPVAAVPGSAPIPASPSPMPSAMLQPAVASAPPAPAAMDSPLMSPWPNATHPVTPQTGGEEPRAVANQAMAVRSPEYTRNNGYDGTRSSVH